VCRDSACRNVRSDVSVRARSCAEFLRLSVFIFTNVMGGNDRHCGVQSVSDFNDFNPSIAKDMS
jgi:hypothetical protein